MVILILSFRAVMLNMCTYYFTASICLAASREKTKYLVRCTLIDISLQTVGVAGEGEDGRL